MATIVGTDIPSGDEVKWYMGGAEATLITAEELVADASDQITLSKNAEYGSVFVVDVNDVPTTVMLEFQTDGTTPATEAVGTKIVTVDTSGTTYYAYYIDIETTALTQVMACKDVSSSLSIDTKETEVHGQVQKLQKVGAAARTVSLEEVDYNDDLIAAIFGDQHTASPAADMKKWTDKFTGVKKISALVGKQTQSGTLKKKWFLMGAQVTSLEHSFPTADYYTKSLEFMVDFMVSVDIA